MNRQTHIYCPGNNPHLRPEAAATKKADREALEEARIGLGSGQVPRVINYPGRCT
jgi:hypothetical protein